MFRVKRCLGRQDTARASFCFPREPGRNVVILFLTPKSAHYHQHYTFASEAEATIAPTASLGLG